VHRTGGVLGVGHEVVDDEDTVPPGGLGVAGTGEDVVPRLGVVGPEDEAHGPTLPAWALSKPTCSLERSTALTTTMSPMDAPLAPLRPTAAHRTSRAAPADRRRPLRLAEVAVAGVHDPDEMPFCTPWTRQSPAEELRPEFLRHHWRHRAGWSPDDWWFEAAWSTTASRSALRPSAPPSSGSPGPPGAARGSARLTTGTGSAPRCAPRCWRWRSSTWVRPGRVRVSRRQRQLDGCVALHRLRVRTARGAGRRGPAPGRTAARHRHRHLAIPTPPPCGGRRPRRVPGDVRRDRARAGVADGLDVVAVGIAHEGSVVVRVVLGPHPRVVQHLGPGDHRGAEERPHGLAVGARRPGGSGGCALVDQWTQPEARPPSVP
jgi:hypothetical protein